MPIQVPVRLGNPDGFVAEARKWEFRDANALHERRIIDAESCCRGAALVVAEDVRFADFEKVQDAFEILGQGFGGIVVVSRNRGLGYTSKIHSNHGVVLSQDGTNGVESEVGKMMRKSLEP